MKPIPVKEIAPAHSQQTNTGRFSIRSLEQVLNGHDMLHELHRHNFFFILALEKGKGIHEIDFVRYEVRDHSLFILRPGQVHRLELKAASTGFLLEFDSAFYQPSDRISNRRWKAATGKSHCEVEKSRFRRLHTALANMLQEYNSKQEGYTEAIKANLDLFFIEYLRQSHNPNGSISGESNYTQDRFEDLMRLLESRIGSIKSVSEYAALLNLSIYQLNSITKTSVGKTVSELINEQIVLEAKRYLLASSSQVKEIADQLGYEDPSYFVRFFKKQTGYSPEAFRKNAK
ncbi:MAG TPA: helix-turn-helix transcriptional regulator [Ferruginibacter sp.]|nr:helix-turn-helix transcriptional regulator [Ferruginibacter sp.]HNN72793.1 helix-turn-helix transcriptional regulator [Ferruginibacter sp.]